MARSKKTLHYLSQTGNIEKISGANMAALPLEDQLILSMMRKVFEEGNAAAFTALMDTAYGKMAPGQGPDLGEDTKVRELDWGGMKNLNKDGKHGDDKANTVSSRSTEDS